VNLREGRFGYVRDAEGLEGVALSKTVPADEVFRCGDRHMHDVLRRVLPRLSDTWGTVCPDSVSF
jgi:hypothetical protein